MEDLYVPLRLSVRSVLWFLQEELKSSNFDHSLIINDYLGEIFLSFKFHYENLSGAIALLRKMGIHFPHTSSGDTVEDVLIRGRDMLFAQIVEVVPDYSEAQSLNPQEQINFSYLGGENLILYIPYVREKYPNVPRSVLIPRAALINSSVYT